MVPAGFTADRSDKTKWRAAGAVSGITLASRVLGMVRDALMMAVMGAALIVYFRKGGRNL